MQACCKAGSPQAAVDALAKAEKYGLDTVGAITPKRFNYLLSQLYRAGDTDSKNGDLVSVYRLLIVIGNSVAASVFMPRFYLFFSHCAFRPYQLQRARGDILIVACLHHRTGNASARNFGVDVRPWSVSEQTTREGKDILRFVACLVMS